MAGKKYLFTPGPTPVPPEVLAALGEPIVHHREPRLQAVYERCLTRLREVCRTERDVLLFTASGTGAFESAVANLVSPGDPHLVVSAGNFGERWADMIGGYGAEVDHLRYEWGETPDPGGRRARLARARGESRLGRPLRDVDRRRQRHPGVRRRREGGRRARRRRRGLEPRRGALRDRRVGPRRRRLRLAEGADDAAGPRPRARSRRPRSPRRDRRRASTSTGSGRARRRRSSTRRSRRPSRSSPRSTSRSGSCSRRASKPRSTGTSASAAPAAPASKAMGLELFSPDEDRSAVVTAVRAPEGIELRRRRAKACATASGSRSRTGRARLKGKIFRIGHIGWFDVFDITTQLAAVELVLADLGAEIERGVARDRGARGVRAAPVAAPADRVTARVLVRESIADAGVELLRDALRRRRRRATRISPRSSAATTRSSSARRRS